MAEASPVPAVSGQACCGEVMDAGVGVEDFISTGRTGRRNAIADINDARLASVSTAGMDFSLDKLSVSDPKPSTSDPSKPGSSTASSTTADQASKTPS